MKFILHLIPAYPATPEERERLRPIAHRTDKTQQLLDEMLEMTQLCEDVGFDVEKEPSGALKREANGRPKKTRRPERR